MEEDTPVASDVPPPVEEVPQEGKPAEDEKADVKVEAADGDETSVKEENADVKVKAEDEGKVAEEGKADVKVEAADGDETSVKEENADVKVKAEDEGKVAEEGKADEKPPTRTGPLVIGYKTFGMGTEASAYYAYLIKNLTHFQDLNDVSPSLLSTPCQHSPKSQIATIFPNVHEMNRVFP
jgi:hypothetical protein